MEFSEVERLKVIGPSMHRGITDFKISRQNLYWPKE